MFFKGKTSNDGSLMIPNMFFKLKSLKILNFLLIAIDVKLKSFLSVNYINHAFLKQFSYETYFSSITYAVENISVRDSEGYFVKRTKYNMKNPQLFFDNVFLCHSGLFISSNKVCDGIMNCGITDNSDEDGCKCKTANEKCKYIVNIAERRQWECSSLYFTAADGKCYSFDHEYNHTKEVNTISRKFVCKNGNEIDVLFVDDLVSDCGESADDEIILQDIIVNHTYYPCDTEGEIPCKNGHKRCFDFSDICVYRLNKYHHLVPCRTGGHLQECHYFECNLKYKCPNSYCIPLGYVCDGKWDCPSGFDEDISHNCYSMPLVRRGLTMSSLNCSLVVARHRLGKSNAPLLFRRLPSNLKGVGSKVRSPETPLLCALFYLKGPAPCCYWLSVYVSYRTFRPYLVRHYLVFC